MNLLDLPCLRKSCHVIALIAVLLSSALAQTNSRPRPSDQAVSELRTARAFESARANLREAIELYVETWGAPEVDVTAQQPFWTFVEIAK